MSHPTTDFRAQVAETPGIHFNELVRRLEVTPDKLHRIATALEERGEIAISRQYGKTHFYPTSFDTWEQRAIALLRRETSREILVVLLERGECKPSAVADSVGIARSTLEWHCDRLVDAGLVTKEVDGGSVQLGASDPDRIARLLDEIEPSFPDRWVDRTTRLVDSLLDSG